ncbi:Uncharacterised protein [Mycobacteroides abscessus subsp. abscessus]|nr:Uncharacterised protein [Mycobacteroides abscessus subsp. abscessus]
MHRAPVHQDRRRAEHRLHGGRRTGLVHGNGVAVGEHAGAGLVRRRNGHENIAKRCGRAQLRGAARHKSDVMPNTQRGHRAKVDGGHGLHLTDVGSGELHLGALGEVERIGENRCEPVSPGAETRGRQRQVGQPAGGTSGAQQHDGEKHRQSAAHHFCPIAARPSSM